MTFRQFVYNNVFRNIRLYVAYFLSSLFTVGVFFTFAMFAFHPVLTDGEMRSDVMQGMMVAGGIIYVFSFFFILYSMNAYLQTRKQEFGVLILHGMSNRQIRWMVFLENMIIGFLATTLGIGVGLLFSKAILLLAENVLVIEGQLQFYFPLLAIVITFVSFIFLFFMISIFIAFFLRTKKLVTLIKGEETEREEPKFSIFLALLSLVFLVTGYGIALYAKEAQVVLALLPVVLVVTIGTYFLFSQFSIFLLQRMKNNKQLFWRKTNMLLFSDLTYRMKDNARSFFLVAIISTVAFSAIGTLFGLNSLLTKGIKEANNTEFQYLPFADETKEEMKGTVENIEATFKKYDIEVVGENVTLHYFIQGEKEQETLIVPVSAYNKYAKLIGEKELEIARDEVLPVGTSDRVIGGTSSIPAPLDEITLNTGTMLPVNWERRGEAKADVLPEVYTYYIVSDERYKELSDSVHSHRTYDWRVEKGSSDKVVDAGRELSEQYIGSFFALDYMIYDINKTYAPIMFVGLFIGIIFFVSAGSFLYFRLYNDFADDEIKFNAIQKIGLSIKEMKKVVSRQMLVLFFTPIIIAIIHGAVALTALSNLFNYNLVTESVAVLGSFFLFQIIYFLIVRYFYTRNLIRSVMK